MAQAANFEDYMKNSVLDLSSIEGNREQNKPQETPINNVITFAGSKLWLDLQLDTGYSLLNSAHATCLNFCFDNNLKQHMFNVVDDLARNEASTCHYNCLNKISRSSDLLKIATQNHPRSVRNNEEFASINTQVKSFNDEYVHKGRKDYLF